MHKFTPSDFIVFTVSSSQEEYDKYLLPSVKAIPGLKAEYIMGDPQTNIAKTYNEFIAKTTEKFIIFAHQDVEFSSDLIQSVNRVYDSHIIGAMGIIGRGFDKVYYFGGDRRGTPKNVHIVKEVNCLDSCCCIIDRTHNQLFDQVTFDGLHCFVEDYCCNEISMGRRNIVMEVNKIDHWGTTTRKQGCQWGNYMEMGRRLNQKWAGKVPTNRT